MKKAANKTGWAVVTGALALVLVGCHNPSEGGSTGSKTMLWNGRDFTGWTRFVPEAGVNVDDVWRIRDGVLSCTGKPNGYIRTDKQYANYRLHVEWRWPETPANSGVLLHASGPDRVWPPCIECQLKGGNAGDLVLMNGTGITVDDVAHQDPARQFVGIKKKNASSEYPAGQWNSYDIECQGGSIRCLVNGVLQNEGTNATVTAGWIGLQSEGGPIEFRNIYLQQN